MPSLDRTPRMPARERRALGGIGSGFVPYTGAIANLDMGLFTIYTLGLITGRYLNLSGDEGIDYLWATDEDLDLITLSGITGDPKLYWDESEDAFRVDKGFIAEFLDVDTLNLNDNEITDSTGTISFVDDHLITTGTITGLLQMGQNLTPTYTTVQHWSDTLQSACIISGGAISDSGGGQIDVAACTGIIKTTASDIGANVFFNYAGDTNVALTNNSINYIYVAYVDIDNAPTINVTTDRTAINNQTEVTVGWVYRVDNDLHILNLGSHYANFMARDCLHVRNVHGFERASGIATSVDGARNVQITEGIIYRHVQRLVIAAFDSSGAHTFSYWHRDGGTGWTETTGVSLINNTNYDDGDGTLGALTPNRYGVHWVYVSTDSHVHIVYGQGDYKLAQAEDATPPTSVPDILEPLAILAAKIIVKEGTNTTTVSSAFDIKFAATQADNHNDLGGLQGGAADDYYHLTTANRTDLTDTGESALHYHDTDRARANHTGTQLAATISDFGEAAQDTVGGILDDGTVGNIVLTYDDVGNVISGATQDGEIDHDSLNNYDANKHIDHTGVDITAGDGLTGGGDISTTRTLTVDIMNRIWMGC